MITESEVYQRNPTPHPAEQERLQRLHLDLDPRSGKLHRDPRGIPKPGLVVHIAVVGRPDEGSDGHVFGHVGDVPAEHFADIEVAVEDRRAE